MTLFKNPCRGTKSLIVNASKNHTVYGLVPEARSRATGNTCNEVGTDV